MMSCPSRIVVLILLLFVLVSCQTPLKIAGTKHQVVAAKWHALAEYAESRIVNYGVTITAKLVIETEEGKSAFKLSNIKFSERENVRNINLLAPSFEHKYICLPLCFQLLEYVSLAGENSATLLDSFFSEHEFELFQFYGDLVILSERFDKLANLYPRTFNTYLLLLARKNTGFTTTKEFIRFWDDSLSEDTFLQFINNPTSVNSAFLNNYLHTPDSQWSVASNSDGLLSDKTEETHGIRQTLPDELWLLPAESTADTALFRFEQELTEVLSWEDAKKMEIVVGEYVCSYQTNLFGVVTAFNGKTVEVNIRGQAKTFKDGVVQDVETGSLFGSNPNLFFIPMSKQQNFTEADIATCYLE